MSHIGSMGLVIHGLQASSTAALGIAAARSDRSGGAADSCCLLQQLLCAALAGPAPELCSVAFAAHCDAATFAEARLHCAPLTEAVSAGAAASLERFVDDAAAEVCQQQHPRIWTSCAQVHCVPPLESLVLCHAQVLQQCKRAASGEAAAPQPLRGFRALLRRPGLRLPGGRAVSLRARIGGSVSALLHADALSLAQQLCSSRGAGICGALLHLRQQAQVSASAGLCAHASREGATVISMC